MSENVCWYGNLGTGRYLSPGEGGGGRIFETPSRQRCDSAHFDGGGRRGKGGG